MERMHSDSDGQIYIVQVTVQRQVDVACGWDQKEEFMMKVKRLKKTKRNVQKRKVRWNFQTEQKTEHHPI